MMSCLTIPILERAGSTIVAEVVVKAAEAEIDVATAATSIGRHWRLVFYLEA